jgi:hypothetical protein
LIKSQVLYQLSYGLLSRVLKPLAPLPVPLA